jgi:hypothetical protein
MAKELRRSIKAAVAMEQIYGLHFHDEDQSTTHQQFVDDTLIMAQPTAKEAKAIKQILANFFEASSTSINLLKS